MKNIKKNYHLLSVLARATPAQRKAILKQATPNEIKVICEICHNTLQGNIPVNISKLKKYKSSIRKLTNKKIPIKKKKKILINQTGGFLPLILGPLLSLVAGTIGRAIGNVI